MNLEQEQELVRQSQEDANAFGRLYDEYDIMIFNYVLRRTANVENAQDITSEVFFKALKSLKRFRWRGVPFSAWLYRIANHEVADYSRDHRYFQDISDVELNHDGMTSPSAESEILEAEAELQKHVGFLKLHKNISRLSVKYQEVIILRFFEKKQLCDISAILNKPEGTVKSLLHRGLGRLKKLMEKDATFSGLRG